MQIGGHCLSKVTSFLQSMTDVTLKSEFFGGISKNCKTVEQYVLEQGQLFKSEPLSKCENKLLKSLYWFDHEKKECYRNAQLLAMQLDFEPIKELVVDNSIEAYYVEGFVCPDISIGIAHAWVSFNDKIIDTTLRSPDTGERVFGVVPEGYEYYGVKIEPIKCEHIIEHQIHISLIDDYVCNWPMIKEYGD